MNNTIKTAVTAVAGVAFVGAAVHQSIRVRREETAKRLEIQKNLNLDLEAIRRASDITHERLNSGGYTGRRVVDLLDDLQNEIDFQKMPSEKISETADPVC